MTTRADLKEEILEPELPIVDPHHHLWDLRPLLAAAPPPSHGFEHVLRLAPLYLLEQLLADLNTGHKVVATVFVECRAMYRSGAAPHMKPVGETEFVNGVAAMSASGLYGATRACAGIVGHADLMLGDQVAEVLQAHIAAGGGRFRGIRHATAYDADESVLAFQNRMPGMMASPDFRRGFAQLHRHGLSFDAWFVEPQLPDAIDLARAFPETAIIIDHVATPLGAGVYAGRKHERFDIWRDNIRTLAGCSNVAVKLGGLGMPFGGSPLFLRETPATSEELAADYSPYVETCIEAFGADRCMFESNFPVDAGASNYAVLWNAFKRLAAGASADEKAALFAGTARRVYRLDI